MTSLTAPAAVPVRFARLARAIAFSTALVTSMACQASQPAADGVVLAAEPANSDGSDWDRARLRLLQSQPADMTDAIAQWKMLSSTGSYGFSSYASFLLTHPGWPDEDRLRRAAENGIDPITSSASTIAGYFDRFPPLTNDGRGRYAAALLATGRRDEAREVARAAWRSGPLSDGIKASLISGFWSDFAVADHDARMDALLWAGATGDAAGAIGYVSAERRPVFAARLAMAQNAPDAAAQVAALGIEAMRDAGFVAARAKSLHGGGNWAAARALLAARPVLDHRPVKPETWYELLLAQARAAANDGQYATAYDIASKVDDAFADGHDVSGESLGVRDDYTSLTWLAGTVALENLRQPDKAVGMFARYGGGARTPQTRSKGFYWAGRAAAMAGDDATATRYFEAAAAYPDHYYGQLALERLGRPIPDLAATAPVTVSAEARGRFNASSLVRASQAVSRMGDWPTQRRFFGALAAQAQTPEDHLLVAELARQIGRRDLAVIAGQSARAKGIDTLQALAFPQMPVPQGLEQSWTVIHAITRQESQYAPHAVSHAGARGLMQLMPGTAREEAGKQGLGYSLDALTDDTNYNIRLGAGYFARMMDVYGGSYPLAVAAYNAGPGNVNKWIRANGDPRLPGMDMVTWIEKIPIYETKNYVQRVLENAVVYDSLHPEHALQRGDNKLSRYLGKSKPG